MVSKLSSSYPILGLQTTLIYPYLLPLILLSLYAKLVKGLSEEMGVEELGSPLKTVAYLSASCLGVYSNYLYVGQTIGGALSERLARGYSSIKRGFPVKGTTATASRISLLYKRANLGIALWATRRDELRNKTAATEFNISMMAPASGSRDGSSNRPVHVDLNLPPGAWDELSDLAAELEQVESQVEREIRHLAESPTEGKEARQERFQRLKTILDEIDSRLDQAREIDLVRSQEHARQQAKLNSLMDRTPFSNGGPTCNSEADPCRPLILPGLSK
ncbi:unnamed protein product [Sphenostylis stenocarpa]|uniref:Uncharacterized protein n=1 Tax=Sphenostylis stenocarpa TaxID=92480 RepID=A0AA86W463_9FABA|nr:unnamed protein product [Sphenostylis stenocarpa]